MNNLLWVDLLDIHKEVVGISITNAIYIYYIYKLIINIFRTKLRITTTTHIKILVITSYNIQQQLLNPYIAILHPAEYIPQLIDIYTIQDAIGSEIDIIIVDLIYIARIGYTNRYDLINIAMLQARAILIVVNQHSIFSKRQDINKFGNLQMAFRIFERSQTVVELKGYHFIYDRCYTSHSYNEAYIVEYANYASQVHHTHICKLTLQPLLETLPPL